jgi:hypothetical protein
MTTEELLDARYNQAHGDVLMYEALKDAVNDTLLLVRAGDNGLVIDIGWDAELGLYIQVTGVADGEYAEPMLTHLPGGTVLLRLGG